MLRRRLLWVSLFLATIVVLNLVWFGASWGYLNGEDFRRKMQGKTLSIDFDRLYSPFPGFMIAKNLKLKALRSGISWELAFEDCRFLLRLLPLRERKALLSFFHADGGTLTFDRLLRDRDGDGAVDSIAKVEVEKREPPGGRWEVAFDRIALDEMRELRVDEYQLRGRSSVRGAMHFEKNADFRIDRFILDIAEADASRDEEAFAKLRDTRIDLVLETYNNRTPNASLLDKLKADLEVAAELTDLKPLQGPLAAVPWLKIDSAKAQALGTIRFAKGEFVPGSDLFLKSDAFRVGFLGQEATGKATARWTVKEQTRFDLIFDRYGLKQEGAQETDVEGPGLLLALESDERWGQKPLEDWRAVVKVPKADLKRLAYLNSFVPEGFGFEVLGGRGSLEAELKASSREAGSGFFKVRTENMDLRYDTIQMKGNLLADIRFQKVDIEKSEFALKDSLISLGHLVLSGDKLDGGPWYGKLKIPEADLRIERPMAFDGRIQLEGKDLRPLLAIYGAMKNLPAWMLNALNMHGVAVDFHAKADPNSLAINDLKASAEDLKLEGWYARQAEDSRGKLLVNYGKLQVGLGVRGDDFEVKLMDAKDWYSGR